jgi:hypothetical protein
MEVGVKVGVLDAHLYAPRHFGMLSGGVVEE